MNHTNHSRPFKNNKPFLVFSIPSLIGCLSLILITTTVISQPVTFQQLKQIELDKLSSGAAAQKKIDSLDDDRLALAHQYRTALNQHTNLEKYNDSLRNIIDSQEDEAKLLENQIGRVSNLERNIIPLMGDMVDALENFVSLDLPFLQEKRTQRIKKLRELFSNSQTSNSEKYRRVLEAYQIENDYGLTIESYEGTLPDEQSNQRVNFLKIGRIAYLYQSIDGSSSFRWSKENNRWEKLDSRFNADITTGIRMAQEQIPSNLLLMPITVPAYLTN